ncbi:MAG: DUF2785 domain-containing protein [Anaerolineae bacterium]|nr:DUF2785 domain-containing protein [Anaerolineae bacterium]
MDTAFLLSIADNDYQLPAQYSIEEVTGELLANIGIPDPEQRELVYDILSQWILDQRYSPDMLHSLIEHLLRNLYVGLGEQGTDSVFIRSFSVLLLGETVNLDNEVPYLTSEEVHAIADFALDYLRREQDKREFVEGKGWAQALEHGQFCFSDLLASRQLSTAKIAIIRHELDAILTDKAGDGAP